MISTVAVIGAVVVAAVVAVSVPPVRRQLARLLVVTTGTVIRTERPHQRR